VWQLQPPLISLFLVNYLAKKNYTHLIDDHAKYLGFGGFFLAI